MQSKSLIASYSCGTFVVASLLLCTCVEPLDIESLGQSDLLVVEGFISTETKEHEVSLSRTTLISSQKFIPEKGANVSIRQGNGVVVSLREASPGIYKTPPFSGEVGKSYTLVITTVNGTAYESDAVVLQATPPIERIYASYLPLNPHGEPGIQIYLDTKDPTMKTRYYRWEYEETYEIKTPFPSKFVWLGGNNFTIRLVQVDNCWASDTSKNVLLRSTQGLTEDRVTAFPLRFIPAESPELVIKYSILAKQYSMSEKSYDFWKHIREVNEHQGTLFDKQPGNIRGNISAVNDKSELVLGYFDASAVSTRREFFVPKQFAESGYTPPLYLQSCVESTPVTVPVSKLGETMDVYKNTLIIAEAGGEGPSVLFLMRIACCDCTSRGTNFKPDFWK